MQLATCATGNMCNWQHGQLATRATGNTCNRQYVQQSTCATGNMCNWQHMQLATRATGNTCNWQHVQLATRATGNTGNWQHVQLTTRATGSFTSCALRNRSSECQSCRRVMLLRLPAHLRKHPGSEGQGRPQEGQGHSALLPKGGGPRSATSPTPPTAGGS